MPELAVQIVAKGPRAAAEAAADRLDTDVELEGLTYSILEEDEDREIWRIDAFPTTPDEAGRTARTLKEAGGLSIVVEPLADADWLEMALSGLPPVRAGRFFVYGVHDRGRAPVNAVKLRIEAGAAFGTGHHGTTVGCLVAYDALLKRTRFPAVLDVGCGTGVLAIAAAKTGSKRALGTDIDPVSVRISNENAAINRVGRVRFRHASGLADAQIQKGAPYDLVFANILARPLVKLSPDIAGALKPGGRCILSGLLRHQERLVRAAYIGQGMRMERRIHRDAWATLVLRKPG
ncbi:50S ribosomal protein L11 methyltransferase [soil metagenome]